MASYTFIHDDGHGWLRVERAEVERLGITPSQCSYVDLAADDVYLEEDCDAAQFMAAKRARGEPVEVESIYHRGESGIRAMPRWPAAQARA